MYKVECYVECYSIYFCIGLVREKRQGGEGQSAGEEGQIALLEKERERGGGPVVKRCRLFPVTFISGVYVSRHHASSVVQRR